jgi:hypothetical protein
LPLIIFGRKVEFNSEKKGGAMFIITDKEAFISKITKQNVVFSLGCFPLLYPL